MPTWKITEKNVGERLDQAAGESAMALPMGEKLFGGDELGCRHGMPPGGGVSVFVR